MTTIVIIEIRCNITLSYNQRLLFINSAWNTVPVSHLRIRLLGLLGPQSVSQLEPLRLLSSAGVYMYALTLDCLQA